MNSKVWFLAFSFSLFVLTASSADAVGIAEDINNLAERAKLTGDTFMQKSLQLRLVYEYNGRFTNQLDRENLKTIAKRASNYLLEIVKIQKALKSKIENYQGQDWDDKYGRTGLWRKLSSNLYAATLSKCQVDFYLALTMEPPQRNKILHEILAQIGSLEATHRSANSQLLRARTTALLARTNLTYKPSAMNQLDSLLAQTNTHDAVYFRAAIEKIKLLGRSNTRQLDTLANKLAQSSCTDDFELILSLVFLQRRLNNPETIKRTVKLFPQTEDFLGSLILSDLSSRSESGQLDNPTLQQISVFEAELAAQTAWKNETRDHKMLLGYLASTKEFQTPLILYVTAVAFADSSPTSAVNLLMKASTLKQQQKGDMLDIEADKIAKQAAQLAYNLFVEAPTGSKQAPAGNKRGQGCSLALEAFDNYHIIAGEKIDEELEYLYTIILNNCGQVTKGKKLLQKIASIPIGNYRDKAKLDLIAHLIQRKQYESEDQKIKLLSQLSILLADRNDCEYTNEAMVLLSAILEKIDELQTDNYDFTKMIQDCRKLAEICYDCFDGPQKQLAGSRLAEASVLTAAKKEDKLSEVEELIKNLAKFYDDAPVDLLRCRARLLTEQDKFGKAAGLWAKICEMRRSEADSPNLRSWKWWRAKFYELYCWSKWPQTQKENVLHTIEVLENNFTDIPPLWAEKLSQLKQQHSNITAGQRQ